MPQSMFRVEGNFRDGVPLGRNILINPDSSPDQYTGGIIIPDSAKPAFPMTGTVIRLGLGLTEKGEYLTSIREGDKILFSKYAGISFTFEDGKSFMVVKEEDILMI